MYWHYEYIGIGHSGQERMRLLVRNEFTYVTLFLEIEIIVQNVNSV